MREQLERAAALLGEAVASAEPLSGGDLSQVARLRLASGATAIAKIGGGARVEADMLTAIRAAGVPAPAMLAADDGLLILEELDDDGGPAGAWSDLGRAVRRLHDATGRDYGWPADHAFGPVEIPNAPTADWPAFWAERRLAPCVEHIPAELGRRLDRLCGRLADLLPERPRPSLLHGDLWTGNVLAAGGRVTGLIDPAAYHGHAEVDLAMLSLFGAPDPAFRESYGPAEAGFEDRQPLYQLWPALVHLRLFGSGYRSMVERLLSRVE